MSNVLEVVPLQQHHDISTFDCGSSPLNEFLGRHAMANNRNGSAQTHVLLGNNTVLGFYSLSASSIVYDEAPPRMRTGLARHPIPILLMARFAVDTNSQGLGFGAALFKDALKRFMIVKSEVGMRAFVVHAKDRRAAAYYQRFGLESFPDNELYLYALAKDIDKVLRGS